MLLFSLFSTARLDKTLVTILSCCTAVSCKIRVHASIGRTDFHTFV